MSENFLTASKWGVNSHCHSDHEIRLLLTPELWTNFLTPELWTKADSSYILLQVLVSLASFDNFFLFCSFFLFSLKDLSQSYYDHVWLYVSPYLFPLTNTLMTCSTYMTAAVAVNRYLDVISADNRYRHLRMSGYAQAMTVLLCATLVNIPR